MGRVMALLPSLSPRDLAQVAWGLASLEDSSDEDPLLGSVASLVAKQAPQVSTKASLLDLPMLACALAKAQGGAVPTGPAADTALDKIAFRLAPVVARLQRWELAALVWTWSQRVPKHLQDRARLAAAAAREDEATLFAKLRNKEWVRKNFGGLLQEEAALRKLQPEEIERSHYGPDTSWYEQRAESKEKQD